MAGTHDIVIRNAEIFDGSGAPPTRSDVAIAGDRIASVGKCEGSGSVEIDARGHALAPGFIDVHSHDDFSALMTPEMDFKIMQGVTTDVVGNCGLGAAPFPVARALLGAMHGGVALAGWEGYGGYLRAIDDNPPSLNIAVLVGHGTLRRAVMGNARREPDRKELDAMRAMVREGIEAGAVGLSTGLIYEPGRYAQTGEVVELAREMAHGGDGLYASHMRNEASGLLDSIRETIEIGERAGVPVQVSHHKASGRDNWGRVAESLRLIEQARARGVDVSADQYPYTSGSTVLAAVVQNGALDEASDGGGIGRVEPDQVLLASTPKHPDWEGLTLQHFCELWNLGGRLAADRILKEEGPGAVVVVGMMTENDVRTVMRHPTTMIGSDGLAMGSRPHPRLYGTFPRVLGRYAREQGLLSMADAVHRMTGMPAAKFRLAGRGLIRTGNFADLVIFDPATILDTATYDNPQQYPRGLSDVIVNGAIVVRDAHHTGARPGRALRRG